MPRRRLRPQGEVIERAAALRGELSAALLRLPSTDAEVVDAVWRGEALGTLLWALQLAELPPYDRPFEPEAVESVDPAGGTLREAEEIRAERESARLWHWRARTTAVQAGGGIDLPARYASFDQLIAATAMRGYEQGLLPAPLRGDFRAYGKVYRHLEPAQAAEAHSIAVERHHALNWLAGEGGSWEAVPLDT
ncbi:MAG TPA: hypothetical protein VHC67_02225 [Gaiellaceae bacterium]|nr:hypothetical protein [Gaiellaceae bacterium]